MKNYLFIFLTGMFFSCANSSNKNSSADSMNAIEDHPLQDTQVAPYPDGYAPPNADIDTSAKVKDSLLNSPH